MTSAFLRPRKIFSFSSLTIDGVLPEILGIDVCGNRLQRQAVNVSLNAMESLWYRVGYTRHLNGPVFYATYVCGRSWH
jgi:hypothetical protein